jgi:hypothetical protein
VFSGQASAWERDAARPHVAYVLPLTHLLLIVVSRVKAAPVPPRGEAESRYESFASTRWSIVIEAAQFGDSFRSRIQCAVALGYFQYLVLHDYG